MYKFFAPTSGTIGFKAILKNNLCNGGYRADYWLHIYCKVTGLLNVILTTTNVLQI